MDVSQPESRFLAFKNYDLVVLFVIGDRLSFFLIENFPLLKAPVVEKARSSSMLSKELPLGICWIKAILKSLFKSMGPC